MVARERLKEFEEASCRSNWSDFTKHIRFTSYVASGAAKHRFGLDKLLYFNWTALEDGFFEEFFPADKKGVNLERFRVVKFRMKDETPVADYHAIRGLCQKVDPGMDDKMKVYYLLSGLNLHLRNHLALLELDTPDGVLKNSKFWNWTLVLTARLLFQLWPRVFTVLFSGYPLVQTTKFYTM